MNMQDVSATVIIPVYKAEAYLRGCLDSVVHQTYQGTYEVLLVDDGSPDSSGAICDEYAEKYPVVRVFHQKNIGVTRTREVAVEKARGQYIFWVDADDTASPELLEKVMAVFQKTHADLVLYGVHYFDGGKLVRVRIPETEDLDTMRRKCIRGDYSTLWKFSVSRDFWIGEHAPGEMERSAADGYMAIRMFMKAAHIETLQDPLYFHLIDNPQSIQHTFDGKRYMGNFYLWYYRLRICEERYQDMCLFCAERAFSGAVKAYSMSLLLHDLPAEYQAELLDAVRYLRKYPIPGRFRDKFLAWCMLHHIEGPCRSYARHKTEKTEKRNRKISRKTGK